MEIPVKFYEDAGHGWYAIKRDLVAFSGVKVSSYSYQKGKTVYLEEDCDASEVFAALTKGGYHSIKVVKESYSERSPIRSYDYYRE